MIAGTLEIQMLANMARLHADMSSAKKSVGSAMASIEKSVDMAKKALTGLVSGIGLTQVIELADKYAKFTAQLKLATDSTSAYATAMNDVHRISKVAQTDIAATGVLYARITNGTRELGIAQQQVSKITEAVNLALRVSGATAAESASAQLQLSQAFASGTLRGEEFNAVNEAAPRLMKALADGMGVPIGALKEMATEGKITSEVMANALPRALVELNEEAKSVMTISGAFTSLKNEVLIFVGTQAQASGSVSILTSGIAALANNLSLLAGVLLTVAASKFAQWIAAGATALYTQAAASAAATAATLAKANADVAATGSAAALTAARVAELRASVLSASGSAALAITTNGLVPAQARATAASAAHSAALVAQTAAMGGASIAGRVLSGVMAFLGGPIGLVITALGLAATAWATWGQSATSGNKEAAESTEISSVSILANLDKQIEKLNERLALAKQGNADLAKEGGPNAERLSGYLAEVNRLKAMGNNLTSVERIQLIEQQGLYDGLSAKLGLVRTKTAEVAAVGQQSKAAEWMEKLATKTEKMNTELEKARKELGASFSPEIEKRIRAQYEEKAKGAGAAAAAVKKEISAYASLSASVRTKIEESNLELSIGKDASEAQRIRIKLDQDIAAGKVVMTAAHRAALDLDLTALEVSQKAQQYAKDEIELYAEQAKARYEASAAAVKTATEEAEKNEELARTFGLTKTAIEALELARLEERRAQIGNINECTRETAELEALIDAKKRSMAAVSTVDALEVSKKANEEMTKDWDNTIKGYDDIFRKGFADMVNGGEGAWKSFTKSLATTFKTSVADQIYKMFAQPFVMKIVASLIGVGGGVAGMANAATGGSDGSGYLGMASNASSLYSGVSSMVTIGSQVAAGTMSIANALGTVAANATGTGISGLLAANGAYGTAAAGSASAMAGGATAALAAIPVWGWAALAAVAVASIFGGRGDKEATGGGIEGNFSGTGFAGNSFSTWKQDGGWFHNDRTGKETGNLDAATAKRFTDAYGAVRQSATQAAASLGLSADAITNYSQSVSLQLGSDAAANEKAVAAMFAGIGDGMARAAAPGIGLLAKEGEAAGQTMARLSTSITTANAWLSILRQRLFQVSLAGGDAASKLADAFGGLENLGAASKSFYETYYTEGERAARSQQDMTKALALVNLTMPTTKEGLRELAGSLDLNTESGRAAYAMLLAIAPEFAVAADLASKFSKETADKLIKTFTGGGQLVPALNSAALKTALLGDTLVSTYSVAGNISRLFLDVNSGLLTFGARTSTLTGGLTGAQLAALQLTGQIEALHQGADRTRIDFVGLSAALEGVDTETFANTVALVFDNLAARISSVIDGIGAERIAVREAALQIVNPAVMGKDAITRAIGGINVNAPSNAALIAAQQALGRADASVGAQAAAVAIAKAQAPSRAALDAAGGTLGATQNATASAQNTLDNTSATERYSRGWWRSRGTRDNPAYAVAQDNLGSAQRNQTLAMSAYEAQLASYGGAQAANAAQVAAAQAQLTAATAAQASTVTAARAAQLAYIASLQDFAIDANKSVGKLGKLREETIKYYEAQKQLADLMGNSAAGLRTTVADYRYSQLSDAQQFYKLQSDFSKNYAMGLSTDGGTLAGYGDKLNAGLNPLLEKAREVLSGSAYDSFAATALARAEAIAGRLETLTPTDYAADSLAMLGQIDTALAALDASSKSAEKIIADAVSAGADKIAGGLRAVISALTGQAIPAFAAGGSHSGGLRIVGERGWEVESTGPSQIFNQQQLGRALSGGGGNTARLEALVERLTQEVGSLKQDIRDISATNARMADLAVRTEQDGQMVYTTAGSPLKTVAA